MLERVSSLSEVNIIRFILGYTKDILKVNKDFAYGGYTFSQKLAFHIPFPPKNQRKSGGAENYRR